MYVSALGNVFMTEIAEALTDAIAQCGRDVEMLRHGLPGRFPGTINLVVAPHEYFTLYEGASEAAVVKAAAESVCVGVEQPGTYWFEYGARYTSYGPLAIDINRRGVTELRRRGVEAYRLHPGYYSGWDAWGGAAATDRPRDVLFLGSLTHRRAQILSQSAPILAQWTCDLRLFRGDQPVRDGTEGFVSGHAKHELLAGSRVLLNVHQGERDYFEWIRILEAISNGCLVLTERSGGYAPLVPGRHFIQAPAAALAAQVDAMLRDEALRAELALGAYEFVRKSMDWVDNVDRLLTLVEGRLSRGAAPADRAAPATPLPETFRRAGRRAPVAATERSVRTTGGQESGQRALRSGGGPRKAGAFDDQRHLAGRSQRLPADRGHHCRAATRLAGVRAGLRYPGLSPGHAGGVGRPHPLQLFGVRARGDRVGGRKYGGQVGARRG